MIEVIVRINKRVHIDTFDDGEELHIPEGALGKLMLDEIPHDRPLEDLDYEIRFSDIGTAGIDEPDAFFGEWFVNRADFDIVEVLIRFDDSIIRIEPEEKVYSLTQRHPDNYLIIKTKYLPKGEENIATVLMKRKA